MAGRVSRFSNSGSDVNYAAERMSDLELRFKEMPQQARDLVCSCVPYRPNNMVPYRELFDVEPLPLDKMPLGSYCKVCHKPYRYSIWVALYQCESCDDYYVPERYPDRHGLCGPCNARLPTRRRVAKPRD